MLVWWSIAALVHVEPHSHANEQIVWMLKGKMEFRLGSEQRTSRSTMPSSIGIGVSQSIRIPSRASLFAGFNL
jgi:hypothetical protein